MNDVIKSLLTRRSVRAYKPEQILEEQLNAVLEAGVYAPTGGGRQSPVIVAVQDKETIRALSKLNAAVMGADKDPFYGAPTVLVVLADSKRSTHVEDGACVMDNLMNAAHAVGLGSCWIHRAKEVFASEEGRKYLHKWGLSDDYVGIGHCILGYADGELPAPAPRKEGYVIRD